MRAKWLGAVLTVAVVVLLGTRRPQLPGSLGVVYAEIHVGMSWDEAAALFAASGDDNAEGKFAYAELRDGTRFGESLWRSDSPARPSSSQIVLGYLNVYDENGRDLYIDFGSDGRASAIRFKSSSTWESLRHTASRLAGR